MTTPTKEQIEQIYDNEELGEECGYCDGKCWPSKEQIFSIIIKWEEIRSKKCEYGTKNR